MAGYLKVFGLLQLLLPVAFASPLSSNFGISFENENQDTALLKLDYATYRGVYNSSTDVSFCSLDELNKVHTYYQTPIC
jgi:hypothetical protein